MTAKRRRFLSSVLAASVASVASVAGSPRLGAADAYTLRVSLPSGEQSTLFIGAALLARGVERRTNGRLKLELYPLGQLAREQASIEGLLGGTIDLTFQSEIIMQPLIPELGVLDLPFLFKDAATAYRVMDGEIGNNFFAALDRKGIIGYYWGATGFRAIATTAKAVRVPADMKGLRIRISGGAVGVAFMQALGAVPITIDSAELYPALMQRTIDGLETGTDQILERKYYVATKNLTVTHHIFSLTPLMGSKKSIEALPPDLQKILREEALATRSTVRTRAAQSEAATLAQLKGLGTAISQPDLAAFRKAVEPVYTAFEPKFGTDFVRHVSRLAGSA